MITNRNRTEKSTALQAIIPIPHADFTRFSRFLHPRRYQNSGPASTLLRHLVPLSFDSGSTAPLHPFAELSGNSAAIFVLKRVDQQGSGHFLTDGPGIHRTARPPGSAILNSCTA